jgi:hypothetical protein
MITDISDLPPRYGQIFATKWQLFFVHVMDAYTKVIWTLYPFISLPHSYPYTTAD